MAITVEGCDAIIAAWRRSGKLLLVGHEMRFSPLHRRMWEIVQDGSVGELRYLLMDLWRRPYRPGAGGWRLDPARVGNWTLEEPVHFFEATSWLLGPEAVPIAVYASGASNGSARDLRPSMVDHFTATVRYNSGAYAVISQTLGAVEHHLSIKLLGSRAMLRAEWHAELDRSQHPNYALEISDQGHLKSIPLDGTPGEYFELREEIATFVRAIGSGGDLPVTPEEARQAVALCLAAQRSLQTGTVIDVARNVR
jgi:myo-inositol 2-dehydrogenase / D-chiro-inositol 1-dehydrogenase